MVEEYLHKYLDLLLILGGCFFSSFVCNRVTKKEIKLLRVKDAFNVLPTGLDK